MLLVSTRYRDDVAILKFAGQMTTEEPGKRSFWDAVNEGINPKVRKLILDFRRVNEIDASGVGELVATFVRVRSIGADFVICEPTPEIREVLVEKELDRVIKIAGTEDDALKLLSATTASASAGSL